MTIKRLKMPNTHSGKRITDRYTCGYGHLHPSHNHALKCIRRNETKDRTDREWYRALGFVVYLKIFCANAWCLNSENWA